MLAQGWAHMNGALNLNRQHLANSLWAMPTLDLLISRRLHAAVAKATQGKDVDCKAQGDQQHFWALARLCGFE